MEKRIDDLRSRTLKNRNKLAAIQAHERKMRKECSKMIEELSKKNMELIWKINKDKELVEKLEKLPKRLLVKKERSIYKPRLKYIKEDEEDLGKSRRKTRRRKTRRSRRKARRSRK